MLVIFLDDEIFSKFYVFCALPFSLKSKKSGFACFFSTASWEAIVTCAMLQCNKLNLPQFNAYYPISKQVFLFNVTFQCHLLPHNEVYFNLTSFYTFLITRRRDLGRAMKGTGHRRKETPFQVWLQEMPKEAVS